MKAPSISRGVRCLWWLRNQEGLWGVERGYASRVTNTAEAVWALSALDSARRDELEEAVIFLKNSVHRENQGKGKNCEHAREYAWVLWALASYGLGLDDSSVQTAVRWLLSEDNRAEWGGWFIPRDQETTSPQERQDSTQATAFSIVALHSICANSAEVEASQTLLAEARARIREGIISLERLGGTERRWGEVKGSPPHPAFTAYAVCAFQAFYETDPARAHDENKAALDYLTSSWKEARHVGAARDAQGSYRHFARAWSLYALAQDSEYANHAGTYELAWEIVKSQNQESQDCGWAGGELATGSSTWGTADALMALEKFSTAATLDSVLKVVNEKVEALYDLDERLLTASADALFDRDIHYVWTLRGKPLAGIRGWVFWALFALYLLAASTFGALRPDGIPLEYVVFAVPLGLNFFAYSFWRKRLHQTIPNVINFLVGLNGLMYTLIVLTFNLWRG